MNKADDIEIFGQSTDHENNSSSDSSPETRSVKSKQDIKVKNYLLNFARLSSALTNSRNYTRVLKTAILLIELQTITSIFMII
jgi:hypothetical protein